MKTGFTLTELLLVVVVLGILSILAIPKFFPKVEKARTSEAIAMLNAIRQGEATYHLEKKSYVAINGAQFADTNLWAKLGLDNPNTGTTKPWRYEVYVDNNASPKEFVAAAKRQNATGPYSTYQNKCITLRRTGQYGPLNDPIPTSCTNTDKHPLGP